jgi:hypothetical protein
LLCQLKAVLVRDLARNYASGRLWAHERVHPEQFEDLQVLPDLLLLVQKILFQLFVLGPRFFSSVMWLLLLLSLRNFQIAFGLRH